MKETQTASEQFTRYGQACPCLHTTPCRPDCTCVKPMMSCGCSRCCTYGSEEQQRHAAERLAKIIDAGNEALISTGEMKSTCTSVSNPKTGGVSIRERAETVSREHREWRQARPTYNFEEDADLTKRIEKEFSSESPKSEASTGVERSERE